MDKLVVFLLQLLQRKIKDDNQLIVKSGPYELHCGDWMVLNTGTWTAKVNGVPLPAGASLSFGANVGEIRDGYVTIDYDTTGAGTKGVYLFRKLYK